MTKMDATCPKCGSHLQLKDGMYGEFLACPRFPDCRYTQPLRIDDKGFLLDKDYQPSSPYCKACNHTGRKPFIKNGIAIPNTSVFCDCKLSYEEINKVRLDVSDFDFAMSDTFRSYSYDYCDQRDPGYIPPAPLQSKTTPPPQPTRVIHHVVYPKRKPVVKKTVSKGIEL